MQAKCVIELKETSWPYCVKHERERMREPQGNSKPHENTAQHTVLVGAGHGRRLRREKGETDKEDEHYQHVEDEVELPFVGKENGARQPPKK